MFISIRKSNLLPVTPRPTGDMSKCSDQFYSPLNPLATIILIAFKKVLTNLNTKNLLIYPPTYITRVIDQLFYDLWLFDVAMVF